MARRSLVANLVCQQDHFSKEVSHLLILFHQEKHHTKQLSLHNQFVEHIYHVHSSLRLLQYFH